MKSVHENPHPPSPPVEIDAIPTHDGYPVDGLAQIRDEESEASAATTTEEQMRLLRRVYDLRRLRSRLLPERLFSEPSWDMLIDLYIADLEGRQISTSSACIASYTTPSTGLRHLGVMEALDIVERRGDPNDGRRVFVALTPEARTAMRRWVHAALTDFSGHERLSATGAVRS